MGWGVDENGDATTDPQKVMDGGGLCPLGGVEMTGGYKGYGLAMMMETLCGVLAGAAFGTDIRGWKTTSTVANLGRRKCFEMLIEFSAILNDLLHDFVFFRILRKSEALNRVTSGRDA